ncbi:hypothetical protein GCM10027030_11960 [Luteococcus sediminum]
MATLPRLVVSAASSSSGKTTIAVGLVAALRERGLQVAPFKTGPDYIDPGYHTLAAGRVGRNLDAHLCGPELIAPLLLHGSLTPTPADVAVIEGAMGLFDGQLGTPAVGRSGYGSSAHIAQLVGAPVLLVVDASKSSRTVAALAHGLASYDHDVRVGGVLLNKAGSQRNIDECTRALDELGLPVVGAVGRHAELDTPSRHLGLVPAAERTQAEAVVEAAGHVVADSIDLDAVLRIAASAGDLAAEPWDPRAVTSPVPGSPVVAVAAGRAFTFRYAETTELLEAAGCRIALFDPTTDTELPPGTSALWIGGGFPEMHAADLAGNTALLRQVRNRVLAGMPTVAECAGLLYLCRSLDRQPMADVLPLEAAMGPRLTLGYKRVTARVDSLLCRAGDEVASHEFHRTQVNLDALDLDALDPDGLAGSGMDVAWEVDGRLEGISADPAGTGRPSLHASYQHLHWAGLPQAAQRFAEAASTSSANTTNSTASTSSATTTTPTASTSSANTTNSEPVEETPDLTHHGDRDLTPGLVDLAVNVHASQPPQWLAEHLAARVHTWAGYPDATAARSALAERHGVEPSMVLPTSGAAEAFTLVARALDCRHPLVVHPQFTEPEQALRVAGHSPDRLLLRPEDSFRLLPEQAAGIDDRVDLVVVGNPTNPTGLLHPAAALRRLARPGRVLLVDEAFMDAVPGEPESLIGPDMTGLLVTRSLTKTWSLAGIRAGYVVGDPELIARLEAAQTPWSVSTPALDAMVATSSAEALDAAARIARQVGADRELLVEALTRAGFPPVAGSQSPFVLVDLSALGPHAHEVGWLRSILAEEGFAVRRGESFPGLGPQWVRLAVREAETSRRLAEALARIHHTHSSSNPRSSNHSKEDTR